MKETFQKVKHFKELTESEEAKLTKCLFFRHKAVKTPNNWYTFNTTWSACGICLGQRSTTKKEKDLKHGSYRTES